jgi:hypothetical protein
MFFPTVPPAPPAMASVAAPMVAQAPSLAPRPLGSLSQELQPLVRELRRHGFSVQLAPPPRLETYGLFDARQRRLWVAPVAFELGIARQTLLHEAVHAAQSCPRGVLVPIGWTVTLPPVVNQEIGGILTTRYGHGNLAVEREAFALQGQPDAVAKIIAALKARCGSQRRTATWKSRP